MTAGAPARETTFRFNNILPMTRGRHLALFVH